jgi:hypothetical protein
MGFAIGVQHFAYACNAGSSAGNGSGVAACNQHMHIISALACSGYGVKGRWVELGVVVFGNDQHCHESFSCGVVVGFVMGVGARVVFR